MSNFCVRLLCLFFMSRFYVKIYYVAFLCSICYVAFLDFSFFNLCRVFSPSPFAKFILAPDNRTILFGVASVSFFPPGGSNCNRTILFCVASAPSSLCDTLTTASAALSKWVEWLCVVYRRPHIYSNFKHNKNPQRWKFIYLYLSMYIYLFIFIYVQYLYLSIFKLGLRDRTGKLGQGRDTNTSE